MELVPGGQIEFQLLQGCCLEANRADVVAFHLDGLRTSLPGPPHPHLTVTIEEIRIASQLLRELAGNSQVHFSRVPVVLDYLEIILPCLSRSLRDITSHYEDRTMTKENRWRKMYHDMTDEAGGLSLPQRFILYNHFLTLLRELLTRSPNFDLNSLESTRLQVMQLRESRRIPPPPIRVGPGIRPDSLLDDSGITSTIHWAEKIFSLPLPSRTALKHQHSGSSLQFWRWSESEGRAKLWASLSLMTWEEMTLLYCCFLSFKVRNSLTVHVAPQEQILHGERKLFQARIVDDGYRHSLIVYEDVLTKGIRLHAAVWDGVLRQCPVWTAFVTHQSASSTWMKRVSKYKIRLADIQLYVFCQNYQQQNQRRGSAGAFEICFISEEASKRFKELFSPPLLTGTTSTDVTQATESTA
ncbi:hypothetical protein AK830_g5586 [Neonectria ditissima]|uniref:Uncharacterized protein n=1 Tax=Neonectria ditissima TaxID=78410 RepID=A0A0P7B4J8_9HYPO|nr:hypothetical protein AK830_g5586 [Neonectria ditissima]